MDEDAGELIWNFVILKKESPSEGGGVRGVSLSTDTQVSNVWRKLSCKKCLPKKDGAS